MGYRERMETLLPYVREAFSGCSSNVGIILGSGLGGLVDRVLEERSCAYSSIPGFPVSTVEGHTGRLVFGRWRSCGVWLVQGRFHYYEGYGMDEVVLPVVLLSGLGVDTLVVSNASGGVNPDFRSGDIMLIEDQINGLPNPLRGPNDASLGERFPSMHDAYSLELRELALAVGADLSLDLRRGVYASTPGPSFETPAEYEMFRRLGGDAVGMSTTGEVIMARYLGMRVLGLSVITNVGGGSHREEVTHAEVQEVGGAASERLGDLVLGMLPQLCDFRGGVEG